MSGSRARCVYVLGAMFHIDANHGAKIMEMTPENFRQILSRSRKKVKGFLDNYCMVNGHCDCMRRLGHANSNPSYSSKKLRISFIKTAFQRKDFAVHQTNGNI